MTTSPPEIKSESTEGVVDLELDGVDKTFVTRSARTHALSDINLTVERGEFVSIVGRSGCGKTTLLRILAGLIEPTGGSVKVAGQTLWGGSRDQGDAASKDFGLVFQEANLFPWYSIQDNIALPLALRGMGKAERRARAREMCELVGLTGFEKSYPRELSGGMRQRASIARSLSYHPTLLLMDEPFGALDALTRDRMNMELQRIAQSTGATVVFVTHSITEAAFLADRVVTLSPRPGRIRSITRIPFDRPRDLELETEPAFQDLIRSLRHDLNEGEH